MRVKARGGVTSGALCRDAVICLVEFWLHAGNRGRSGFCTWLSTRAMACIDAASRRVSIGQISGITPEKSSYGGRGFHGGHGNEEQVNIATDRQPMTNWLPSAIVHNISRRRADSKRIGPSPSDS